MSTGPKRERARKQLDDLLTERQLQKLLVEKLRLLGYLVLQIGAYHRQVSCPQCHHHFSPRTGYGNDAGAPDLLISHPRWTEGIWLGVELKRPRGGRLRTSQETYVTLKRTYVVRNEAELDRLLAEVETLLGETRKEKTTPCLKDANTPNLKLPGSPST